MEKITLVEAQKALLGIIESVEAGVTTPDEAVFELAGIKEAAPAEFKADYTLQDFQTIAKKSQSDYQSSTGGCGDDVVEAEPFESSYQSSY